MSFNWKEAVISPQATIRDAIQAIDKESLRIALVVEDNDRLVGVVTDGDIRRGLLRRLDLDDPVRQVMNASPVVCTSSDSMEKIRRILSDKVLLHMPIVDNGRITNLVTWDQLSSRRRYENPVVLMAGGFGTRLLPLTEKTPKPLLKVGEKPLLQTILERFIESGFTQFYISLHYLPQMVMDHFGDGSNWGVSITYLHEDSPLGTAGVLGLLPHNELPDLPILVMNGDLLTRVDFEHLLIFHLEHGGSATICLREYRMQVPYGVVHTQGHKATKIVEKPQHQFFVNAGIYVLNRDVVRNVEPEVVLDMPTLLTREIEAGNTVTTFPVHEYWLDIGERKDFEQAQIDYLRDFE